MSLTDTPDMPTDAPSPSVLAVYFEHRNTNILFDESAVSDISVVFKVT